jgi:Core-2/I-Branching enzyme
MRIACIIMAHKEPQQIERFIKKFTSLPFDFYIHLDKKIDRIPFDYLAKLPQVYFIEKRIRVRWASYNFFHAEIQSFKEVSASGKEYDFISVMSGQDYPIKPAPEILHFLEKRPGKNFISYEDDGIWWSRAITRINKYHFTNFGFRGRYRIQFLLNSLLPARKFPLPYTLYGGPRAMCMTLSKDCAAYIVDFIESNKKLRNFLRFTWGADEFVIPTLIMNSIFRDTVINNNFYYIDWSKGGASPKTLRTEDYELLLASDKMLARKFDITIDSAILDKLDETIKGL